MGKGKSDVELVLAYTDAEKEPADISAQEKPDPWEMDIWNKRLSEFKIERYRRKKELSKMEFRLKSARRLLQTCLKLRQNHPQKATLINLWENLAKERIHKNNESEQAWLKLRLEQLEEAQALVESVLEKWANSARY